MINWLKTHKLLLVLTLVIAFLLQNKLNPPVSPLSNSLSTKESFGPDTTSLAVDMDRTQIGAPSDIGYFPPGYEKVSGSSERIVIQNSSLSLLVEDVRETGDRILATVKSMGGFMVDVNYSNPEEQGYATISVRVPTDRLDEALREFRSSAVKVTSENLMGTDVTEQYEDLDRRIETLEATRAKFEEILEKAVTVDEIIRINQEIINIDSQIDQATGQKMALSDNARLTKVTVFLSTDELALPYTPDEAFRPGVIFKKAVRSLLGSVQDLAGLLIWLGVYSVIWVPILLLAIYLKKRKRKSDSRPSSSLSAKN